MRTFVIGVVFAVVFLASANPSLAAEGTQGMSVQGMSVQGMSVQGMSVQGMSVQGMSVQGASVQGASVEGVAAPRFGGGVRLQAGPDDAADGDFIAAPGRRDVAGTLWQLELRDGAGRWLGAADLRVVSVERDRQRNLSREPANDDVWLYELETRATGASGWTPLCPADRYGRRHALAIPGPGGDRARVAFACTASGVAAKCARHWGYKWWKKVPARLWNGRELVDEVVDLEPFWRTCMVAARADYCQDGRSFTRDGTLIDLYDSLDGRTSFQASADPGAPGVELFDESRISVHERVVDRLTPAQLEALSADARALVSRLRVWRLERPRYDDLDPAGTCAASAWIVRPDAPAALAAAPSAVVRGAFIVVRSPRPKK